MSHISKEFGIDEALKQLDVQKENKGTSIGKDFLPVEK